MKFTHPSFLILSLLLTGCVSNVHNIGRIGQNKFHSVHEQTLSGPNVTLIYREYPDGTLEQVTSANGPGVATAIIGAGGSVGSSLVLRPARTTVNTGGGSSSSTSESGGTTSTTSNSFVPPGQVNNPGHGDH